MKRYDMLLSTLNTLKEVRGRTKLQKIVYVLKNLNFPFQEEFEFYLYGPYSEQLASKLHDLYVIGLVDEKSEGNTSIYSLSSDSLTPKIEVNELDAKLKDALMELNQMDSKFLELLATAFYLRDVYPDYPVSELEKKAIGLKPKFTPQDATKAFNLTKELEEKYNPHPGYEVA